MQAVSPHAKALYHGFSLYLAEFYNLIQDSDALGNPEMAMVGNAALSLGGMFLVLAWPRGEERTEFRRNQNRAQSFNGHNPGGCSSKSINFFLPKPTRPFECPGCAFYGGPTEKE
jgi:hypothetical protein